MTQVACKVEDCDRRVAARGLCGKHYARWKKHGDPQVTLRVRESHETRNRFVRFTPTIWSRWLSQRLDEPADAQALQLRQGIEDMRRLLDASETRAKNRTAVTGAPLGIMLHLPAVRRAVLGVITEEFDRMQSAAGVPK